MHTFAVNLNGIKPLLDIYLEYIYDKTKFQLRIIETTGKQENDVKCCI